MHNELTANIGGAADSGLRLPRMAFRSLFGSKGAQNALGKPAWRRIALAVWRLGIPTGTAKFRLVIGLCQISWLSVPWRTRKQPAPRNRSRSALSNCGAIHA